MTRKHETAIINSVVVFAASIRYKIISHPRLRDVFDDVVPLLVAAKSAAQTIDEVCGRFVLGFFHLH